jgi:4-amino-4-deoxy-L-arabinose transferase-like glycosyltransferase
LKPIFLAALALLAAFWVATTHLQRDSLWIDEGYSLSIVRDDQAPESLRDLHGFLLSSLRDTVAGIADDVHPPLYFLLLDGWTWLAGESVFSVRLLSTFFATLGLAATYALGRRLFDYRAGLIALLILGTAGMMVYYSREARMYTLLLAIGALAMLAYLRWLDRPTWRRN